MLNLGISEMVLIAVVACLVVDPKKVPGTLKHVGLYYKKFQEIKTEVLDALKAIYANSISGNDDISTDGDENSYHIYGNDGKLYKGYKIRDLINKEKRKNVAYISPDATAYVAAEPLDVANNDAVVNCNSSKGEDTHANEEKDSNNPGI